MKKSHRNFPTFTLQLNEPDGGAPDYMEPLTAYRAWQLKGNVIPELLSLNGVPWVPKQAMVATCTRGMHRFANGRWDGNGWVNDNMPPSVGCTCGIYAGKNLEHLHDIGYAAMGAVHGEVSLWGKVMDCDLGYRAQYAYPKYFVVQPWTVMGKLCEAESKLAYLADFDVDIFVANETHVSRNMDKTLLREKGGKNFIPEGIDRLTNGVQQIYDTISKSTKRQPSEGDRLFITGHGIGIIKAIHSDSVEAMLFNTTMYRILRKDICWNLDNFRFECTPTSISTRGVRR